MTTMTSRKTDAAVDPAPPAGETGAGVRGVLALIGELPDRQQEVVRLKFQGGLSYREIAEVMDTTANNVGVLLHTAVKAIRTRMAAAPCPGTPPPATTR
jgi:RNA polymerase sigma-70 factor (ECF subfamily)